MQELRPLVREYFPAQFTPDPVLDSAPQDQSIGIPHELVIINTVPYSILIHWLWLGDGHVTSGQVVSSEDSTVILRELAGATGEGPGILRLKAHPGQVFMFAQSVGEVPLQ